MARLFLKNNILSTVTQTNNVFGSSGSNDSLIIKNTALGTSINSNVEKIQFEGTIADYKFAVQGTQLLVYTAGQLLANIGIQTDSNGTALTFSDLSTTATLTGLGIATLGKTSLSATATPYSATQVSTGGAASTLLTQAQAKTKSNASIDTTALLATTSNIVQSLNASMQESDWKWHKTNLTYSYNTSVPQDYITNNITTTGFKPASTSVQAVTDAYMQAADALIALSISKTSDAGDIRMNTIAPSGSENGHAYYPSSYWQHGGDIFLTNTIGTNTEVNNDINSGKYGSMTINHELGHALGLKHPFEDGVVLPTAQDHRVHSIMSYTDYKSLVPPIFIGTKNTDGSLNVGLKDNTYYSQFPDSFMVYDIATLQALYGADTTTNTGNNTYYFDPAGTVRTAVYEEGAFYYSLPMYHSIWDAGGTDTLNFASTTHSNTIKLTSGSYSAVDYRSVATQIAEQQAKYYTDLGTHYYDSWVADTYNKYSADIYTGENALGIAFGTVIENAVGGSAADTFYDNSVNNVLTGNAGDDVFYMGAGGFDTITGGDGTDKLVLSLSKASVQLEKQSTGETLVVASNFAVSLIGVERIQFSDQLYMVV